jgi:hypothetical protein
MDDVGLELIEQPPERSYRQEGDLGAGPLVDFLVSNTVAGEQAFELTRSGGDGDLLSRVGLCAGEVYGAVDDAVTDILTVVQEV